MVGGGGVCVLVACCLLHRRLVGGRWVRIARGGRLLSRTFRFIVFPVLVLLEAYCISGSGRVYIVERVRGAFWMRGRIVRIGLVSFRFLDLDRWAVNRGRICR